MAQTDTIRVVLGSTALRDYDTRRTRPVPFSIREAIRSALDRRGGGGVLDGAPLHVRLRRADVEWVEADAVEMARYYADRDRDLWAAPDGKAAAFGRLARQVGGILARLELQDRAKSPRFRATA